MAFLYVCLFSNGHIKVGRSITPFSRIASHVERVACLGVALVDSSDVECVGPSEPRERVLIDRCADACEQRFKSEWFTGLDYATVCSWAREAARLDLPVANNFKTYYQPLNPAERAALAKRMGTTVGYCHQIAFGDKNIELGLADVIVAASRGALTLDNLPLTERAQFQRKARQPV